MRLKMLIAGMMMGGVAWAQPGVPPGMQPGVPPGTQPGVPPGFAFLDQNYDGWLSPQELSRASGKVTPEVSRFLDFDGDGRISPYEWQQGREVVRRPGAAMADTLQRGTQQLYGLQPPSSYRYDLYDSMRNRYYDQRRAVDRAVDDHYDDLRDRYGDHRRAVDRAVQQRYGDLRYRQDDLRNRYDDHRRVVDRALQDRRNDLRHDLGHGRPHHHLKSFGRDDRQRGAGVHSRPGPHDKPKMNKHWGHPGAGHRGHDR